MNAAQAKRLPLRQVLAALGFQPHRQDRRRAELWYVSPFRQETTPSFKVDEAKNLWYDFGLPGGGNIIDFATTYFQVDVAGALAQLERLSGPDPTAPALVPPARVGAAEPASPLRDGRVRPLTNRALLVYLARRGIPAPLARAYLREIHYRRGDKAYFALAFGNRSGGYELRNPYFKGTLAPKDLTYLASAAQNVAIFEGFLDFLSALTAGLLPEARPGVVVLNSASLAERAAAVLASRRPDVVELYFDNDATGRQLTRCFESRLQGVRVVDRSADYGDYKDLNDWLVGHRQEPAEIGPLPC